MGGRLSKCIVAVTGRIGKGVVVVTKGLVHVLL